MVLSFRAVAGKKCTKVRGLVLRKYERPKKRIESINIRWKILMSGVDKTKIPETFNKWTAPRVNAIHIIKKDFRKLIFFNIEKKLILLFVKVFSRSCMKRNSQL